MVKKTTLLFPLTLTLPTSPGNLKELTTKPKSALRIITSSKYCPFFYTVKSFRDSSTVQCTYYIPTALLAQPEPNAILSN